MDLSALTNFFAGGAGGADAATGAALLAALKRAGALEALLRLHGVAGQALPYPDGRLMVLSPERRLLAQLRALAPQLARVLDAPAFDIEELTVLLLAPVFDAAAADPDAADADLAAEDAAYAAWCLDQYADLTNGASCTDRARGVPGAGSAGGDDWRTELRNDGRLRAFREGFQLGRLTLVAGEVPGEWRQGAAGAFELHLARDVDPAAALQALRAREHAICEALGWTSCTFGDAAGHILTVAPPDPA